MVILFLINPFLGVLLGFSFLVLSKREIIPFKLIAIIFSIFLGLINIFKNREEGDIVSYLRYFDFAYENSFIDFLSAFQIEPLFYIFTFLSSKLFLGNFSFFILICTFIMYYLLSMGIINFYKRLDLPNSLLKISLISVFFFPLIFTWSFHLLRQILAFSLFINFIIIYITKHKINYFLIVSAVLTHTSIFLYAPIMIYYFIIRFYTKTKAIILSLLISILISLTYASIITKFEYVNNTVTRISNSNFNDGLDINQTILFIVYILFIVCIYKWIKIKQSTQILLAITILTSLIIIATSTFAPLISYRFAVNIYMLIPFVLYLFTDKRLFKTKVFLVIFSLSIFIWFNYYLANGPWDYGNLDNIYFNHFFNNFYGLLN